MDDALARIKSLLHEDVGRNVGPLMTATRGALAGAARTLAQARAVGLVTGFFVPGGEVAAAETDGPVAAALLAAALERVGIACRLLTDPPCANACGVALAAAGCRDVPLDVHQSDEDSIARWRAAGIDTALSIERCGQGADGRMRNMRGQDLGAHATPLDAVFAAGPWTTIAIGDGGNEIGMGSLPPALLAASVRLGDRIACVTPARHLVVAGVSHWGGWGLVAALATLRPDWRDTLRPYLDAAPNRHILARMVAEGPAVDGVSLARACTIDGLDLDRHHGKLAAIRAAMEAG